MAARATNGWTAGGMITIPNSLLITVISHFSGMFEQLLPSADISSTPRESEHNALNIHSQTSSSQPGNQVWIITTFVSYCLS
jgi:hypothetical protein